MILQINLLLFFLCSNFLLPAVSIAQSGNTGVRFHAYMQDILPGIPRKTIKEDGTEVISKPVKSSRYFLYLEYHKKDSIQVKKLWIHGKAFSFSKEPVYKLPVVIVNSALEPGKSIQDTLVKETNYSVLQVVPLEATHGIKVNKNIRKKIKTRDVLMEYTCNGRLRYISVISIKKLHPVALQ